MTREDILTEIKALAAAVSGVKPELISAETRLQGDLGLDGDDAAEFMDAFTGKFDVDMAEFYWYRFFGDEGLNPLEPAASFAACALSARFRRRWRAARDEEREITLAHLADVAASKRWTHPGPGHRRTRRPTLLIRALAFIFVTITLTSTLAFAAFSGIVIYGMASGALGEIDARVGSIALVMTLYPTFMVWAAWSAIRRKLTSAP